MNTETNDCPDRETLEYETRSWIYPDKEPVPLTTFVMKHISDILSDPDWRAWLGKVGQSDKSSRLDLTPHDGEDIFGNRGFSGNRY